LIKNLPPKKNLKLSPEVSAFGGTTGQAFRYRFKARRAERGFGLCPSARRASRAQNQFGFFQIHTSK